MELVETDRELSNKLPKSPQSGTANDGENKSFQCFMTTDQNEAVDNPSVSHNESITICKPNLSKEEWNYLAGSLSNDHKLCYLTFQNVQLDPNGLAVIQAVITGSRRLYVLNLWGCSLVHSSKSSFANLMESISKTNTMTELGLMDCHLEPEAWMAVANATNSLQSLYLEGSNFGSEACQKLANNLTGNACTLSRLSLPASIGLEGQIALANAMKHKDCTLQELYLNDNILSLQTCQALSKALNMNSSLVSLGLEKIRMPSTGRYELLRAIPKSCLQNLGLNMDERSADDWLSLAQMLSTNPSLVCLTLESKSEIQPMNVCMLGHALETNYNLEYVSVPPTSTGSAVDLVRMHFFLELNQMGRKQTILGKKGSTKPGDWIKMLANCGDNLSALYYFLSEKPDLLVASSIQ